MVRTGSKATHKCSRAEGSFSGPSKVQGPVLKPNSVILLRYNSLPCGTECFTGCREAQTTNAREKQACSWFGLIGCRDVITSCVSASFSLVAAILDALLSLQSCFLLYLWIYCLSFVHNSAFPLFSSIESYTQFSALPVLYFVSFNVFFFTCCVLATTLVLLESTVRSISYFIALKHGHCPPVF